MTTTVTSSTAGGRTQRPSRTSESRSTRQPRITTQAKVYHPTTTAMQSSPKITASPSSTDDGQVLIIRLSTTLTVSDYHRFYDTPTHSFTPTYDALPDGSLLTQPYIADQRYAYSDLIFLSIMTIVFCRNILVAGDYIYRGKVKKKGLFYLLFASQLLAPVALIPLLVVFFHNSLNCNIVYHIICIICFFSISILITGILGIKAYLCLERSRPVAIILCIIQIVWFAVQIADMVGLYGRRQLSGGCVRETDGLVPVMVVIQCVQSFFISCCFMFAVWKSSGVPAARGRISIQLSMGDPDELPNHHLDATQAENSENPHVRRGWWDYVPGNEKPPDMSGKTLETLQARQFLGDVRTSVRRVWAAGESSLEINPARKTSLPGEYPVHQHSRPSTVRISEHLPSSINDRLGNTREGSPGPSFSSRRSGLMPRMLFREVIRDELYYTTFITLSCVAVTVLAVIGCNSKKALSVFHWFLLNWVIISLLAIHSFGRVVRRHEIEATLQHPRSWAPSPRMGRRTVEAPRNGKLRRTWSPRTSTPSRISASIASYRRSRRSAAVSPHDLDLEHGDPDDAELRLNHASNVKGGDDTQSIRSVTGLSLHSTLPSIASSMKLPLHHVSAITNSSSTANFRFPDPAMISSSTETKSWNQQQHIFIPIDSHDQHRPS